MNKILSSLLLVAGLAVPLRSIENPSMQLAVIIHKDNALEKLSITEARLYWMRRGTQKNWATLKVMVLPVDRKGACAEKALFYKHVIKLTEAQTDSYFAAKQYQGAENPPVKLNSDREVIQYVADNKAGIGYVNLASLKDDDKNLVKVVCVVSE
jgi:ABC-type phosphate transport system substrate-binding protein